MKKLLLEIQKFKPKFNINKVKALRKARMGVSEIFTQPLSKTLEKKLIEFSKF